MREVIERLRREKAEFEEKAKRAGDLKAAAQEEQRHREFSAGKEAALEWVKNASYEAISLYKKSANVRYEDETIKKILGKYDFSFAWAEGWLAGVGEVLETL